MHRFAHALKRSWFNEISYLRDCPLLGVCRRRSRTDITNAEKLVQWNVSCLHHAGPSSPPGMASPRQYLRLRGWTSKWVAGVPHDRHTDLNFRLYPNMQQRCLRRPHDWITQCWPPCCMLCSRVWMPILQRVYRILELLGLFQIM